MITIGLDEQTGILTLQPAGLLAAEDFAQVAAAVDPFVEAHGKLKAVIIEAAHFPGWENFGAAAQHLRFIRDHHEDIAKLAIVTDSPLGSVAEHIGSHFIAAEVRHFPAAQAAEAHTWAAA